MDEQQMTQQFILRGLLLSSIVGAFLFSTGGDFRANRLGWVLAQAAGDEYDTISGVLDQVNIAEKKGTITTDVGKHVAFQIAKPELFMNLSPGQRITLKLDKEGRAVRVMDNAAPELPPPPSGPR